MQQAEAEEAEEIPRQRPLDVAHLSKPQYSASNDGSGIVTLLLALRRLLQIEDARNVALQKENHVELLNHLGAGEVHRVAGEGNPLVPRAALREIVHFGAVFDNVLQYGAARWYLCSGAVAVAS